MAKLFIGGISPNLSELQLAELLAIYGEILTVKLIYDRKTNKAKGFGFVEMADHSSALNAIQALNGKTLGKRELQLNLVTDASEEQDGLTPESTRPIGPREKRPRKAIYQPVSRNKTS